MRQRSVRQETTVVIAGTPPLYLYEREIKSGEPVSLERSDFEEQQENSRKQGKKEDGILSYGFPCDDGDMVTFHLWDIDSL